MKGFFITGTDTGVGKTVVSALVAVLLIENGFSVAVRKPIETGSNTPCDGLFLKNITGTPDGLDVITPIRFTHPLAPLAAAQLENKAIDIDEIIRAFDGISNTSIAIVEGIGGLLVPITKDFFAADLIKRLALPAILVSSNKLGTINHTLLSLEYMKHNGIEAAGIIFNNNNIGRDDISVDTNIELIRQLTGVPVIAAVPFLEAINYNTLAAVSKTVNYDIIRGFL
ncbi:MAG: dethiobiotin synthase [Nitrospirae bacterium]|nr:dethiobiotin synthase [Nitrospirota bacterium]